MPLTDTAIRKARPSTKPMKLFDGGGLFLLVTPAGGKWWRLQYRFNGKQNTLSMGVYPEISLKQARERRDHARKQLADGIDPGQNRKAHKAARASDGDNTFEVIAREWMQKQSDWSESNKEKIVRMFERDLFPWIGGRPIVQITPRELLKTVERIEERGAIETAHRALHDSGRVIRYAIATDRASRDIANDLRGALSPIRNGHHAAITDPQKVGKLMRDIRHYQGGLVTRCALRLAPLVFLRPVELRYAEWAEVDLDRAEWIIPARRMKLKSQGDHLVPLSRQAIEIFQELKPLTGEGRLVFPSLRSQERPISENAVLVALRSMGYSKDEMTGHGFRAMARTLMDEVLHVRPDYIEHQLAHAVRDPNGRAYNRTSHLDGRRKMMQDWADYLDQLADASQDRQD